MNAADSEVAYRPKLILAFMQQTIRQCDCIRTLTLITLRDWSVNLNPDDDERTRGTDYLASSQKWHAYYCIGANLIETSGCGWLRPLSPLLARRLRWWQRSAQSRR